MSHPRSVVHAAFLLAGLLLVLCACRRSGVTLAPADGLGADAKSRPAVQEAPKEVGKAETAPGDGFPFPDDRGGELLGKLLTPTVKLPPDEDRAGPRRFPRSAVVDAPTPLPSGQPDVARLPADKPPTPPRPGPVADGPPLADYLGTPRPPESERLLTGERTRLLSEDVNQPVPLPLLGQQTPDRAPLDDPTAEASLAAALAATMPQRTTPAPFLKLAVPDPFENRRAVRLATVPPEDQTPASASPRLPKP
jgi:hypothetical protein